MKKMSVNKTLMMTTINFAVMYLLTYAAIASFDHLLPNINKAYMALIMAAPMLALNLILNGSMYDNQRVVRIILATSGLVFLLGFTAIRQQAFVGDEAFLRSMIPHHSSAILMCEQASIEDTEIIELCDDIITAQLEEIAIMERLLAENNR